MEEDRVIAVVTGANGGVGLGLCQRLLTIYSLPPGTVIPEALPQSNALLASTPDSGARSTVLAGPALTLVLAVRNARAGEETRKELLVYIREILVKREKGEGIRYNKIWMDRLRIEVQVVDFERPDGERGVGAFAERLKMEYPYITSFYANAGYMASDYIQWHKVLPELLKKGAFRTFAYPDQYQKEHQGEMTRDGKLGRVWSINTLAPYLLIKELASHLERSPRSLPVQPRFIYTSSSTAELSMFDNRDITDVQMIGYDKTYSTSKYASNAVITELDRMLHEHSSGIVEGIQGQDDATQAGSTELPIARDKGEGQRRMRCLLAEPAIVQTRVGAANFRNWWIFASVVTAFQWLVFYTCRLLGSPYHVRDGQDAATALLYTSLVPDRYLPMANDMIKRRFGLIAHPFSDATVEIKECDSWDTERAQEILRVQMQGLEREWKGMKVRQKLGVEGDGVGGGGGESSGLVTPV